MIDISRCMLGALTCSYDMSYVCVTCHRSLLHMPWQTDRHTHTQMHHTDASHRCITQMQHTDALHKHGVPSYVSIITCRDTSLLLHLCRYVSISTPMPWPRRLSHDRCLSRQMPLTTHVIRTYVICKRHLYHILKKLISGMCL